MFYFDVINNKKVLKSDYLADVMAFFSTREGMPEIQAEKIIVPEQTHSDNVQFVTDKNSYPNTDGLILTTSGVGIRLKFADCTPLIFYDKSQKIGAIAHAGWKGTAKSIGIKTIKKMGSNPQDIIAVIGPAISMCCYEVSEDVKTQLLQTVNDITSLYNDRYVDLKKINARQLTEFGVKSIDICPYCTSCNNDLFYSYRKENGTSERHYAFLKL